MGATLKYWNPKYVDLGNGGADIAGPWFEAMQAHEIVLQADWSAVASTAGTIALQGSHDYTLGVTPNPSSQSIVTLTALVTHGAQPAGGTAGSLVLTLEKPTALIRAIYTRSAGGGANQFQIRMLARAWD